MRDVRRALADDHPLGLMAFASSLLAMVDRRQVDPFAPGKPAGPSRQDLLGTFIQVERPETSALLSAIGALGADEIERHRIARVLERRRHTLPAWLAAVDAAVASRTAEVVHVLGDGDNVVVGVRFPAGQELSAVVYIDHNVGTLVKDAFVVPEPAGELLTFMQAKAGDPNTTVADIPAADARARIVDAIEKGAITFPPFETDTWPACRPLVEWVVGLLPEGGRGYERPEWSDGDRRDLIERFYGSPFAGGLDDPDHRELLDTFLWFGCDYGPGDPMRWSPVAVEIILLDWVPRKVVAGAAYLGKVPALLRAFVRFCHAERGIPSRLTDETVAAVDRWEPGYRTTIRSPRPRGPAALLATMGLLDPDGPWDLADDDDGEDDDDSDDDDDIALWDYGAQMVKLLQRAVGGPEALDALDDEPLPDEAFDWTGIPADIHDPVADTLALCDRCCDELLDAEVRTAARRVLARIARRGPEVFRRRGRADTAAAAICWAVGQANDLFDQRRGGLTQKTLLEHFGVRGSISSRAATLLRAGELPIVSRDVGLGSPAYLVSDRRRAILDRHRRFSPG